MKSYPCLIFVIFRCAAFSFHLTFCRMYSASGYCQDYVLALISCVQFRLIPWSSAFLCTDNIAHCCDMSYVNPDIPNMKAISSCKYTVNIINSEIDILVQFLQKHCQSIFKPKVLCNHHQLINHKQISFGLPEAVQLWSLWEIIRQALALRGRFVPQKWNTSGILRLPRISQFCFHLFYCLKCEIWARFTNINFSWVEGHFLALPKLTRIFFFRKKAKQSNLKVYCNK